MRALFITQSRFPDNSAECKRRMLLARLFLLNNIDVLIAGLGDYSGDRIQNYNGIDFISLRGKGTSLVHRLWDRMIINNHRIRNTLNKFGPFDCILVFGCSNKALCDLKRYASKHNVMLVHDCVEWYSPDQFAGGKWNLDFRQNQVWNSRLIDKSFKVIAISRYLQNNFRNRNIATFYLPAVTDVSSSPCVEKPDGERIKIIYAGAPGRKDYINTIIQAYSSISDEEKQKSELIIIGADKEQLINICGVNEELLKSSNNITIKGRIPHEAVLTAYKTADFSILIRPQNQVYAKAGFPTKVPESLATGTPVICNLTSDLGDFLTDGVNAIIAKDETIESVKEALQKAIHMSKEQRKSMEKSARNTAEDCFDYRLYAEAMGEFLKA